MRLSKEKVLLVLFLILLMTIILKSIVNILKEFTEIKNPPVKISVEICPPKKIGSFKNLANGGYLYALYRYESLGIKCKKQ